ncbi:MAG: hypothetical protein CME70_08910 [Halobacteriovorax sp.]|nr:hypothetical protein [Halobacteriovorax sp.]
MELDKKDKIDRINKISPSFCLAKWLQVTIDLVHGTNHSCHHPNRHKIPLAELEKNPSALHNTNFKKSVRKEMLEGVRPPECEYCWQVEDVTGSEPSDRHIKSMDHWAYPHLDKIAGLPWDADVIPTYVEVMFDKSCNLACAYCISDISSSIEAEIKKFGPYKMLDPHRLSRHEPAAKNEDENPYVKAFWKWMPSIYKGLDTLRITGGEPLLSKNTFKLLDFFEENPNPELTLALNCNLCVRDEILDKFLDRLEEVWSQGNIKKCDFYISVDTFGKHAEYIRKNLEYDKFISNISKLKDRFPKMEIIINATYGIYSIPHFKNFLEQIYELKQKYGWIVVDTSYLSHPMYLRANMVTEDFHPLIKECLEYMGERPSEFGGKGFSTHELEKLTRVYHWVIAKRPSEEHNQNRADFYTFITQLDERYPGTFPEVFPEYEKFWAHCKKAFFFIKKLTTE